MLTFFRKKNDPARVAAERLYDGLVVQARQPVFFSDYWVPDTVDGRFDMVLMHSFVVMRRLGNGNQAARDLSQALYDVMFVEMDRAVREMGIGDLSVKRHVRRMMRAFNGRMEAYEMGLADHARMRDALRRNLYGTVKGFVPFEIVDVIAEYLRESVQAVATMEMAMLMGGEALWAPLPGTSPYQHEFKKSA